MANERDFEVDEVKESYRVAFTAEDVAAIQRFHIAPTVAMTVVWSLLAVILGVSVFTGKETSVAGGILFGGALCIAVFL